MMSMENSIQASSESSMEKVSVLAGMSMENSAIQASMAEKASSESPKDITVEKVSVLAEKEPHNVMIPPPKSKKTPPLSLRQFMEQNKKAIPPNPVKVPPKKIFGYQERYMSPTDSIISPVSKGLLAKNRRMMRPVPAFVPPKVLDSSFQDVEPAKLKEPTKLEVLENNPIA